MKYRSEAGLECFIIRSDHGGCCKWCAALAGKYRYPEEVPKDVYRRHDNCTCTVTYISGRKAQDVWSKTSRELPTEERERMKIEGSKTPHISAEERERMKQIGFKKPTISSEERERMLIAGMKKPQRLDFSAESGIINTGAISGALNPMSKKAEQHAAQYYEAVRHMKTDTARISQATGIAKDKLDKIKEHVFIKEHDLINGKRRFDPDYEMAQSWQRLINGNFKEQDIVLLKHEYAELRYMEKGLTQNEAHIKASRKYDFAKYCE